LTERLGKYIKYLSIISIQLRISGIMELLVARMNIFSPYKSAILI